MYVTIVTVSYQLTYNVFSLFIHFFIDWMIHSIKISCNLCEIKRHNWLSFGKVTQISHEIENISQLEQ